MVAVWRDSWLSKPGHCFEAIVSKSGCSCCGRGGEFQTNGVEDFTAISFYLGKQRLDLLAYLGHVSATDDLRANYCHYFAHFFHRGRARLTHS